MRSKGVIDPSPLDARIRLCMLKAMTRAQQFLSNHKESLPGALGIELTEWDEARVVAQLRLDSRHLNEFGAVQGGIVMAIADIAGAFGAVLNLPEGYITTTLESKTNFLGRGAGNVLWAESQPIHIGRTTSVWRTIIWRGSTLGDRVRISDVTQTQLNLAAPDAAPAALVALERVPEPVQDAPAAPTDEDPGEPIVRIADIRRQEILRGACKVILEKGFAKTSVREIAEAADMPIATMYKYVGSKEEILELMYESFINDFHEQLDQAVSNSSTPQEKFRHAIDATIRSFDKHHKEVKLLFTESKALGRDALRRIYAQDRRYLDQWKAIVSDIGVDRRLGVDPELLANFIYYLMTVWPMRHWSLARWSLDEVRHALIAFVTAAVQEAPGSRKD